LGALAPWRPTARRPGARRPTDVSPAFPRAEHAYRPDSLPTSPGAREASWPITWRLGPDGHRGAPQPSKTQSPPPAPGAPRIHLPPTSCITTFHLDTPFFMQYTIVEIALMSHVERVSHARNTSRKKANTPRARNMAKRLPERKTERHGQPGRGSNGSS